MKVSEYIYQVGEEMDKSGQPYFEKDDLLSRLKVETYKFIDVNLPYVQFNQRAKEDFSKITKPFLLTTNSGGHFPFVVALFYRLVSISAKKGIKESIIVIHQSNDILKMIEDPFHTPTEDEYIGEIYDGGIKCYPTPDSVSGLNIVHPTFGSADNDELITELPLNVQYHIIQSVVASLMVTTGDSRFQMEFYQNGKQ